MESNNFWKWLAISLLFVLASWVSLTIYLLVNPTSIFANGTFGDSFGWFNSLFSGLAFAAIMVSLIIQRKDLQSSVGEMKEANIPTERVAKIQLVNSRIQSLDLKQRIEQFRIEHNLTTTFDPIYESVNELQKELGNILLEIEEAKTSPQ